MIIFNEHHAINLKAPRPASYSLFDTLPTTNSSLTTIAHQNETNNNAPSYIGRIFILFCFSTHPFQHTTIHIYHVCLTMGETLRSQRGGRMATARFLGAPFGLLELDQDLPVTFV